MINHLIGNPHRGGKDTQDDIPLMSGLDGFEPFFVE